MKPLDGFPAERALLASRIRALAALIGARALTCAHVLALLLLPLPVLMAPPGLSERYAFRDALDHVFHRRFDEVAQRTGGLFSPGALVFHAQRQTGGSVVQVDLPARRDRAMRMMVAMPYGESVIAYMDPYTGDLRGPERYAALVAVMDRLLGVAYDGSDGTEATPNTEPHAMLAAPFSAGKDSSGRTDSTGRFPEDLCSAESEGLSGSGRASLALDDAIDGFQRAGISFPYTVLLPQGENGYYLARGNTGDLIEPIGME
jgi:uncharacterized iron-regulated membrane protein